MLSRRDFLKATGACSLVPVLLLKKSPPTEIIDLPEPKKDELLADAGRAEHQGLVWSDRPKYFHGSPPGPEKYCLLWETFNGVPQPTISFLSPTLIHIDLCSEFGPPWVDMLIDPVHGKLTTIPKPMVQSVIQGAFNPWLTTKLSNNAGWRMIGKWETLHIFLQMVTLEHANEIRRNNIGILGRWDRPSPGWPVPNKNAQCCTCVGDNRSYGLSGHVWYRDGRQANS